MGFKSSLTPSRKVLWILLALAVLMGVGTNFWPTSEGKTWLCRVWVLAFSLWGMFMGIQAVKQRNWIAVLVCDMQVALWLWVLFNVLGGVSNPQQFHGLP